MSPKILPAQEHRREILVVNSRFIATVSPACSVEEARAFIDRTKQEFADASHNVPAFIIGHGHSVTEHCNDDGEPQGTAGRPMLAVLKGSGLGDVAAVVTRYFGGTKLGKGGLVRAYGDALKAALANLPLAQKVATHTLRTTLPYPLFEQTRLLIVDHGGEILDEVFTVDVTVTARFRQAAAPAFEAALIELSRGTVRAELIESNDEMIMPLDSDEK